MSKSHGPPSAGRHGNDVRVRKGCGPADTQVFSSPCSNEQMAPSPKSDLEIRTGLVGVEWGISGHCGK